jgi:electron transport complex protein RnfD
MSEKSENTQKLLLLQSSPHIARQDSVPKIMTRVIVALLPVTVFGVVNFGIMALLNVAVSIAAAVVAEALFRRATKQEIRLKDCSAVVTGLLLALTLPPSIPLWMTALGAVFAIVVAKEFFGGLGANVFNPALAGRAFMLMSFPAQMTTWLNPAKLAFRPDGSTGATPLAYLKTGEINDALSGASALVPSQFDLFLGFRGGCIGETSIFLVLIGGIYLLVTGTIDWRAPLGMLGSAALLSVCLGLGPVTTLLTGGLVFGAIFMATDYTSAPVTETGKLLFGIGAGIIVVLVRKFGSYPEGVMFSILIMNAVTPFLNRILHKKYGYIKPKKPAAQGGAK